MRIALLLTFLIATTVNAESVTPSKHIQKIMTKGNGLTEATAFKVSSVEDEYQIARALKLKVQSQSLIVQKRPFDVFKTTNEAGETQDLWFDISSFYP